MTDTTLTQQAEQAGTHVQVVIMVKFRGCLKSRNLSVRAYRRQTLCRNPHFDRLSVTTIVTFDTASATEF